MPIQASQNLVACETLFCSSQYTIAPMIGPMNVCIPPSSDIMTTLPEYSTEPASGFIACWKNAHSQPATIGKSAESTNALTRYLSTS